MASITYTAMRLPATGVPFVTATPGVARAGAGARGERRNVERRQLLLARPVAQERRVFDRRSADRATRTETPSARARNASPRKGLIVDIYV